MAKAEIWLEISAPLALPGQPSYDEHTVLVSGKMGRCGRGLAIHPHIPSL